MRWLFLFALCYISFNPIIVKAEPNWKNTVDQLVKCADEESLECALDLAEEAALSMHTGKPFSANSFAPPGPVLLSDVIVQRVLRGEMKKAEELYETALLERMQEGFNSNRPIIIAQNWLAVGYLRQGSALQFSQMIDNSFGYDGKITSVNLRSEKVRRAIQFLNKDRRPFDQVIVAQTILEWISQQEQKQEFAERITIYLIENGNLEAAEIVLKQYDSEKSRSRLLRAKAKIEKSITIADLLKNGETSKIISLIKEDRISGKTPMSYHVALQVKALAKRYSNTDRSELIRPLLLVAGAYGKEITNRVCKSGFTKRIINLAVNYVDKATLKDLSATLNLDDAAIKPRQKCGPRTIMMDRSNIDLALAMSGDKAAEKRFFSAGQYSESRYYGVEQYGAILSLLTDAPELAPDQIRSLFENASLLKSKNQKNDRAVDIVRDAKHLVRSGYNNEALRMLGDLFSGSEFNQRRNAQSNKAQYEKQLILLGLNSLFHWRNLI